MDKGVAEAPVVSGGAHNKDNNIKKLEKVSVFPKGFLESLPNGSRTTLSGYFYVGSTTVSVTSVTSPSCSIENVATASASGQFTTNKNTALNGNGSHMKPPLVNPQITDLLRSYGLGEIKHLASVTIPVSNSTKTTFTSTSNAKVSFSADGAPPHISQNVQLPEILQNLLRSCSRSVVNDNNKPVLNGNLTVPVTVSFPQVQVNNTSSSRFLSASDKNLTIFAPCHKNDKQDFSSPKGSSMPERYNILVGQTKVQRFPSYFANETVVAKEELSASQSSSSSINNVVTASLNSSGTVTDRYSKLSNMCVFTENSRNIDFTPTSLPGVLRKPITNSAIHVVASGPKLGVALTEARSSVTKDANIHSPKFLPVIGNHGTTIGSSPDCSAYKARIPISEQRKDLLPNFKSHTADLSARKAPPAFIPVKNGSWKNDRRRFEKLNLTGLRDSESDESETTLRKVGDLVLTNGCSGSLASEPSSSVDSTTKIQMVVDEKIKDPIIYYPVTPMMLSWTEIPQYPSTSGNFNTLKDPKTELQDLKQTSQATTSVSPSPSHLRRNKRKQELPGSRIRNWCIHEGKVGDFNSKIHRWQTPVEAGNSNGATSYYSTPSLVTNAAVLDPTETCARIREFCSNKANTCARIRPYLRPSPKRRKKMCDSLLAVADSLGESLPTCSRQRPFLRKKWKERDRSNYNWFTPLVHWSRAERRFVSLSERLKKKEKLIVRMSPSKRKWQEPSPGLPLALQYSWLKTYEGPPLVTLGKSRIHGVGVFAAEDIEEDMLFLEFFGELVRATVTDRRETAYRKKGFANTYVNMFRINEDYVIDATLRGGIARFINHSCQPNCYAKVITYDKQKRIVLVAKRDIEKGDEICYDYKLPHEQEKIPCNCKAPSCLGFLN